MTYLLALLGALVLAGAVAVLYFRFRAATAEARLATAESAAAGARDEASRLAGALAVLRAKTDDEAKADHEAALAAARNPAAAGAFLRDSVRGSPGVPDAPKGPLPPSLRAHAPRFVAGFGRER